MTQYEAYLAGRTAAMTGKPRTDCPHPLPVDALGRDADGSLLGAFWLDGWEYARKQAAVSRTAR